MAKQSLLLVDGDARSLRVLEVSLKKAGFNVTTAVNGRDALDKVQTAQPDLIISDTHMPEMDGFAFCEELKTNSKWADIPFIFLTQETSVENKIRGLELGVEDYLTKPIYIKEILTRIRILLQKHQRARLEGKRGNRTRFAGRISDINVVDLIQTIEVSRKSGLIHFRAAADKRAVLYFRDGKVVDAEAAPLQGEDAVYRLLTWSEGEFEVIFRNVRRKDVIKMSSQALLMEGMRRLDEWGRLLEQLPPLDTRFEVDAPELADRLAELPDELNSILKLFDGRRSLMELIDASDYGDLECLEVIAKLYFEGLILERADSRAQDAQDAPASIPQPERPAPASVPEHAVSERAVQEHTISQEELDITNVDVAPQPQTSLVEAAIGAATPVDLDSHQAMEDEGEYAGEGYEDEGEHEGEDEGEHEGEDEGEGEGEDEYEGEDEGEDAGEDEGEGEGEGEYEDEGEYEGEDGYEDGASGSDPGRAIGVSRGRLSRISVVSSEGAEVAMASGEVDVFSPATEITDPAREIITIVPQRPDDDDAVDEHRHLASVEVNFASESEDGPEISGDAPADAPAHAHDDDLVPRASASLQHGVDVDIEETPAMQDGDDGIPIDTAEPVSEEWADEDPEPRFPAVGPVADERVIEPPWAGRGRLVAVAVASLAVVVLLIVVTRGNGAPPARSDASVTVAGSDASAADAQAAVAVVTPVDAGPPDARSIPDARPKPDARAETRDTRPDARPRPAPVDAGTPDARPVKPPDPIQEPPQKGYKEYVAEARAAYRKKRHDEALALIEQALAERRTAGALTLKADILLDQGNAAGALEAINDAVKRGSRYAQAWLIKGQVHLAREEYGQVKTAFQKYLELNPNGRDADMVRTLLDSL